MLGKSSLSGTSSTSVDNQIFVYEVEGLRQNIQTDRNSYPIRNSRTTLVKIPYHRMNDEMQRITRLGGKIVRICSLSQYSSMNKSTLKANRAQSKNVSASLPRDSAPNFGRRLAGTLGGGRRQLYRVRVMQAAKDGLPQTRRSMDEIVVTYNQLSPTLKWLNQRGSKVVDVSPA